MDYKHALENIRPKAIELGKNVETRIETIYHELMRNINPLVCSMEGHKIVRSPLNASYDVRSCRRKGCDFHKTVPWIDPDDCWKPPIIEIAGRKVTILPVAKHYFDY